MAMGLSWLLQGTAEKEFCHRRERFTMERAFMMLIAVYGFNFLFSPDCTDRLT